MSSSQSGYQERPHTADIALHVWAGTLSDLFRQAGMGLGEMLKARVDETAEVTHASLTLQEIDPESLLVAFISELLYFFEQDGVLLTPTEVLLENDRLDARLEGRPVVDAGREIKAVTYSDLRILQVDGKFETTLVFDI